MRQSFRKLELAAVMLWLATSGHGRGMLTISPVIGRVPWLQ
jgi:hypothetical protein